jgi:hypothetical protein
MHPLKIQALFNIETDILLRKLQLHQDKVIWRKKLHEVLHQKLFGLVLIAQNHLRCNVFIAQKKSV